MAFRPEVVGFASIAYDTHGYGYGAKDKDGTPLCRRASPPRKEADVPYVVRQTLGSAVRRGTTFTQDRRDVIITAWTRRPGAATSCLVIGREDVMVNIRRALGMAGDRYGTSSSYGIGLHVMLDPGKEAPHSGSGPQSSCSATTPSTYRQVDELYEIRHI